mgnify:CR=1 FL=1
MLFRSRTHSLYPRLAAPEFEPNGGTVPPGFTLHMTATTAIYCTLDGSDPRLPGGSVHPQAIRLPAAADLVIDRSVTLRARACEGTDWSALHEARFIVGRLPGPGDLAISELNYHPADPTEAEVLVGCKDPSAFEFIELVNTSDQPLDLRGLRFSRGIEFDWLDYAIDTLHLCCIVVCESDCEVNFESKIRVMSRDRAFYYYFN